MSEERKDLKELLQNSKVQKVEVKNELEKSFISYAMAVNVSRAIPDVRDGLKPVHRRILFDMAEQNLFHTHKFVKSATIVGDVLGHYHPHGDSSVYDALVRLAQDFSINCPLVDGHGNFGSIDGDGAAAYRYTEARLTKIAGLLLEDIDKETVDMYPNFDDTRMQPRVLPAKFPNLLVNGADGIAVGMATNIPPHNLAECCQGVQAMLANPQITDDELIEIIKAPDFPTGGIIMGRTGIINAYKTGRGNIVVRGKAEIEEHHNGRQRIIISEIPYQVNKWFMRPLIEKGHVYIAQPPLYKLEKGKKEYYFYNDDELEQFYKENGNGVGDMQRYKGLGEMDPEQLWDTTLNPENRILLQVNMQDAVEADRVFNELMGEDVELRRKFIEENATLAGELDV